MSHLIMFEVARLHTYIGITIYYLRCATITTFPTDTTNAVSTVRNANGPMNPAVLPVPIVTNSIQDRICPN